MTNAPGPRRNPWLVAFVLSLASLAAALVALGVAVAGVMREDDDDPAIAVTVTTLPANDDPLKAWLDPAVGIDISSLPPDTFEATSDVAEADVVIRADGDGEAFVAGRWVVVTAMHAGVDELTMAQVSGLLTGTITDWREVGGVPGEASAALVQADAAWISAAAGAGVSTAVTYPDYDALLGAMTADSGIVSVVPLDRVNVAVRAIEVDGIDIVRGVGSADSWPLAKIARVEGMTNDGRDVAEALAGALEEALPVATTVIATGDILINRCSLARVEATGDWGAALRTPVGEYLASADLTLGQYDGSIQDLYDVYRCEETTNLSSPPDVIESLTAGGIDGLSLATNHIADCGFGAGCGMEALLRTIELLEGAGIVTYGAGSNLDEALAPAIFDVGGVRYGVLGLDDVAASFLEATPDSPGTAPLDDSYADEIADGLYYTPFFGTAEQLRLERFTRLIRELDAQVDVVVVQVETGTEDTHRPSDRSVKALRAAADAGADIIVGNQAHWVQAAEVWNGVFVPYALGNFIYDQTHTPEHRQGYILETTLWGAQVVNVKLVPYQIEDLYRPEFATGDLRTKILGDVFGAAEEMVAEGR